MSRYGRSFLGHQERSLPARRSIPARLNINIAERHAAVIADPPKADSRGLRSGEAPSDRVSAAFSTNSSLFEFSLHPLALLPSASVILYRLASSPSSRWNLAFPSTIFREELIYSSRNSESLSLCTSPRLRALVSPSTLSTL